MSFDVRWTAVRFYGPVTDSNLNCNLATINGVKNQPYLACSMPSEEDWKDKEAWVLKADEFYRKHMSLSFIGIGEITKVNRV